MAPTLFLGLRLVTTTFLYDDPERPNRPTGSLSSPEWTPEDRALVMGLADYEAGLCECGHPRAVAWHSEMDGFFEGDAYVCHACTARRGKQVAYTVARNTRPDEKGPLPEFVLGVTTVDP